MKKYIACIIVIFSTVIQSMGQGAASIFRIEDIPEEGIALDKGWKFRAGDHPYWVIDSLDHPEWKLSDPTSELHKLPAVRNAEIGWFRLDLVVDSSLLGKQFALVISNMGASELYLNGVLHYRFGVVSDRYSSEVTRLFRNKLLSIKLGSDTLQSIAIRYSFNRENLYLKFANVRPLHKLVLKPMDTAFSAHVKENSFDSTLRSIQVSFYLPLGFLLSFLFISFRPKKEYLFSGIFCLSMFAAILLHIFALSEPTTVSRSNYLLLATQVFYIAGALAFINSIYILYEKKRSWFFYLILLYGAFSLPYYFISYDQSGLFNAFFFPIINLEFLRLNILAVRRKRKGAWILLVTSLLLTVSLLLYIGFTMYDMYKSSVFLQSVSFILPGIGLSLFYAGEFARTSSELQARAKEVQQLSEEMVAKEREKQQILASQNEILEKQVNERTAALQQSMQDLKEAEAQLIQREKMASLGELTAGIAHEIQNPLNFVNNFSEVSNELIDELHMELGKGNMGGVESIAGDIRQNLHKISHHGKRADAIVKGMLQHSRISNGIKEPTDLNVLCDEYLRLAFHGLRAKDKSFNTKIITDFDQHPEKVNVIPQDIGRVVLNLLTNAFYSVSEKKKSSEGEFDPVVSLSTRHSASHAEIIVSDNGGGISQVVLEKIFQPFFTTKPTGKGTGLGLSLSYDIVTQGHGGELKVLSVEGEGAEFIIKLPK